MATPQKNSSAVGSKKPAALPQRTGSKTREAAKDRLTTREISLNMHERDASAFSVSETYARSGEGPMMPQRSDLAKLAAFEITCYEDACKLRDELVVRYVFNFPEACEEFNSLFSGPFEVFNTDLFMQSNPRTQQTVQGLTRFACRCPFLACALCLDIEIDTWLYTVPAALAKIQPEDEKFTPAFTGEVKVAFDPIKGNPYQNATFDHGTITNRIAYYLFNFFGIEADLGCNSYIWRGPFSQTGFVHRTDLRLNDSTIVDPSEDLENCNDQLLRVAGYEDTQILIANADPCCGDDGVLSLAPSPTVEASSGAFDFAGCMGGCVPLPKIVLMQGQGLNVTVDVLPGLQRLRDEMLALCEIRDVNPTNLGDEVVYKQHVAHWVSTATTPQFLYLTGPCGTIVLANGDQVPDGWLIFVLNENTGVVSDVQVRWGHAWIAAENTYVATTAAFSAPVGPFTSSASGGAHSSLPFSGVGLPAATQPTTYLDVEQITTPLGPAATKLIRHGKMVLTFTIRGAYLTYPQAMAMIMSYGAVAASLAEHYLKNDEVAKHVGRLMRKIPEAFNIEKKDSKKFAGVAGVATPDDVRSAIGKMTNSMAPLQALIRAAELADDEEEAQD